MKDGLYSGLDADFYDELLDGEIDDLPFWRSLMGEPGLRALEVGCGTGRILIPLLKEGFHVDGMDNSANMVRLLREKTSEQTLKTDIRIQRMEELDMGKRYSLIFIPGFSLQMVASRKLLIESLLRFHQHLEPGGRLAVSLFFPWEEMENDHPGDWHLRKKVKRRDGSKLTCHQSSAIDLEKQTLLVKNRYTLSDRSGNELREEFRDLRLLWFYPHELHLLLQKTGFELLETFADFRNEPLDENTPHAVFLARKRDD
ncbi:MAG: class I SAM-dependent methyltransferase [Verrucomicrobia bacterium]|nr:class I SAM-dependent methyltransferase [Verrucomicrobiota bacterium]MDA1066929.1 class I SAM-dependent methyltransferase [Verrucomicrobiota bacterium]